MRLTLNSVEDGINADNGEAIIKVENEKITAMIVN
jgi:hypothetical protein